MEIKNEWIFAVHGGSCATSCYWQHVVKVLKIKLAVWTSIRVVARSTDDKAVACEQHRASNQSVLQASGSSPLRWEGFLGEQSPRQTGDAL